MSDDSPHAFGSDGATAKPLPNFIPKERKPVIPREQRAEGQLDKLPEPKGWKILIVPYTPPNKTKGGILLPESTQKIEELAATIGYVAALGPDAYSDENKFLTGPWCKRGDYILFGRYAGARIIMQGEDDDDLPLRIINDDEVIAVINNPEDYVGVA